MESITCDAIVLDIEGTTSAASHVYDVLFPYARVRMREWITSHPDDPITSDAVAQVAEAIGVRTDDIDAVVAQLQNWIDEDVKAAPLKTLQGLIWSDGYARGDLTSHVFDDVRPSLTQWAAQGLLLAIYSSGSVAAQRALFANAPGGDLNPLFAENFDLGTAGPKRDPDSYRRISSALGIPADRLLFLSDIQDELDAAHEAGWQAVGVLRAGEAQATATVTPHISRFDELTVVRAEPEDSRAGRT